MNDSLQDHEFRRDEWDAQEREAANLAAAQPAVDKATPRPTLIALARNLKNAAWACGTDEYREGVSDSACRRRGTELDAAENALNDALAALTRFPAPRTVKPPQSAAANRRAGDG